MARGNSVRKAKAPEQFQDSGAIPRDRARTRVPGSGISDADSSFEQGRSDSDRKAPAEAVLEENVEEIKAWEMATLQSRSPVEQLSDWIAAKAASTPAVLAHVLWFVSWIAINLGWIPGVAPFDRFPFPFLTLTVSLEAIFLSLFVLASQNRLARQADRRSHLDLQIDLLAER